MRKEMNIGVLSDTHLAAPTEEFLEIIERHFSDVELVLHAGDYVDESIVDYLSSRDFIGVAGNMDSHDISRRLPAKKIVELSGFKIGLIHGWGAPGGIEKKIRQSFEQVDCIVFGHTHSAHNRQVGNTLLFNPGSPKGSWHSRSRTIGRLHLDESIRGEIIHI
jgi:putative phosphoesterase